MLKSFFTEDEDQDLKDNYNILLNNGLYENGDIRYNSTKKNYQYLAPIPAKLKPPNSKGVMIDIDSDCSHRAFLGAAPPKTYTINLGADINFILNENFGNILKNAQIRALNFDRKNNSSFTNKTRTITNTSEFDIDSIDFFLPDENQLSFKDLCVLQPYISIENFEHSIRDEPSLAIDCNFKNLTNPLLPRTTTIDFTFRDQLRVVLYANRIDLKTNAVTQLKYHIKTPVLKFKEKKCQVSFPALTMPNDYKVVEATQHIRNPKVRAQAEQKYTIDYLKQEDKINEILNMEANNISWNQFYNKFSNFKITTNDIDGSIEGSLKDIRTKIQNIINITHDFKNITTICDNNGDITCYNGYRYEVTDLEYSYDIYLDNIYVGLNWFDTANLSIFFHPNEELLIFTDSDNREMVLPYNTITKSGSQRNTYACIDEDIIYPGYLLNLSPMNLSENVTKSDNNELIALMSYENIGDGYKAWVPLSFSAGLPLASVIDRFDQPILLRNLPSAVANKNVILLDEHPSADKYITPNIILDKKDLEIFKRFNKKHSSPSWITIK